MIVYEAAVPPATGNEMGPGTMIDRRVWHRNYGEGTGHIVGRMDAAEHDLDPDELYAEVVVETDDGENGRAVAEHIGRTVSDFFTYDNAFVDEVVREQDTFEFEFGPVPLDRFLAERKGNCVVQGMTAGLLLESLYLGRKLRGTGTMNCSHKYEETDGGRRFVSGHAWAEYVEPDRTRFVVDPVKDYYGPPVDDAGWNYLPDRTLVPRIFDIADIL